MESKAFFRKQVLAIRKDLAPSRAAEMSRPVISRLMSLDAYKEASHVLAYASFGQETDTWAFCHEVLRSGRRLALPRVEGKDMAFYPVTDLEKLVPGPFGIKEPPGGQEEIFWPEALVVMPGVAFDRYRHRIGYGGGYYDRYLKRHPGREHAAIAFNFQLFDEIPSDENDISPGILITEDRLFGASAIDF